MFENDKSRLGQQVGNYRLTEWLGEGGFADVYLNQGLTNPTTSCILNSNEGVEHPGRAATVTSM